MGTLNHVFQFFASFPDSAFRLLVWRDNIPSSMASKPQWLSLTGKKVGGKFGWLMAQERCFRRPTWRWGFVPICRRHFPWSDMLWPLLLLPFGIFPLVNINLCEPAV